MPSNILNIRMTYLHDKINIFYKKKNGIFKKVLEKIINSMLNKCRYINGESLERHNWGNNPIKLKHIPKDIKSSSFEKELLDALNLDDNEKSIIELDWGDIQVGKRLQACIIMWISVYILQRPVLYIFRNLAIDQKQLQDDIVGTENYNFNIQFIKNMFEEFNSELQEYFGEHNVEYWKDYKLPELKDINSNDIINKLSNKEAINSNDIFCCLMNHSQLEKLNTKFSEYIYYNHELVNITVLVDESDLMCPTSSNNRCNDNDKNDSTALCEILLAKIYKKVKYSLHITGTAHSLLYNITTRLNDNTDIQLKISKVHKLVRPDDYYGLFNDSIYFNTTQIISWWELQDETGKKIRYDIVNDYKINIKNIIENISTRPTNKYNHLLISEEKIRAQQFCLVNKIIKDFPNLFIVIYHGNCLRLYLSKVYEKEIKSWSKWDSEQSSTNQRLYQFGGIHGSPEYTEKSEELPNNYCYFNINTKILNIKFVYKLLRILFEKSDVPIICKTIITITGKYGERGYSFTSDDYDKYSLHLTDQYFVSHASLNCTDISQRLRLQGKYNDLELKNGIMKLTLWTTPIVNRVINNFYVKFIKEIENDIMDCNSWEDIKYLLESIIDNGVFNFQEYMRYIDVAKRRKNYKIIKKYEHKHNGYKWRKIDSITDNEISEWCKKQNLPDYICINEIKEMKKDDFINIYGTYKNKQEFRKLKQFDFEEINKVIDDISRESKIKLAPITNKWFRTRLDNFKEYGYYPESCRGSLEKILTKDLENLNDMTRFGELKDRRVNVCYNEYDELYICVSFKTEEKQLPKTTYDYIKDTPYTVIEDNVKYSVLKDEYRNVSGDDNNLPNKYYWKTPSDWLYMYDKDKPEIYSLEIISPSPSINIIPSTMTTESLINKDILLFVDSCCKKTDKKNLRFGLKEIFKIYETWCKINNKKCFKVQKKFKEEFEKMNFKEENSKGVDINNNHGKRGYNLMVQL